jgi:hypothetical protein
VSYLIESTGAVVGVSGHRTEEAWVQRAEVAILGDELAMFEPLQINIDNLK